MPPHLWLNGRLLPADAARIDPTDRGLLLGDGLFETVRAAGGRVPLLARHLARLRDGAALLGIPVPYADEEFGTAAGELLRANGLVAGAVRLTLTRGPALRGLPPPAEPTPTVLIAAFPAAPASPPLRAVVATVTRRDEGSPLSRVKALSYLDSILALREARARGADEALLLNTQGRLACATTANIFLVTAHGELVTPPLGEGVLPGTTRALALKLALRLGLGAREAVLTPGDLASAAEVFVTSSQRLLTPLVAVEGRPVGTGAPGPVAARLLAALLEATRA